MYSRNIENVCKFQKKLYRFSTKKQQKYGKIIYSVYKIMCNDHDSLIKY